MINIQTWPIEDISEKHMQVTAIAQYVLEKCAEHNLETEQLTLDLSQQDMADIEQAVREDERRLWIKTRPQDAIYDPPPERKRLRSVYGLYLRVTGDAPAGIVRLFLHGFNYDWDVYQKAIGPLVFRIGEADDPQTD